MQYAHINGESRPPEKGLQGTCRSCGEAMIAKCGEQRMWHWAHRGRRHCDPWWEPETIWHRSWKNLFPIEWHEQAARDEEGEKHIADIRTPLGLVVEFQYSHLAPEERRARERFHENMLWVVSGARLTKDFPRFEKARSDFRRTDKGSLFLVYFPDEVFPKAWLDSAVPVLFDFRASDAQLPSTKVQEFLWCLLPGPAEGRAVVAAMSRSYFVRRVSSGAVLLDHHAIVDHCVAAVRKERARDEAIQTAEFLKTLSPRHRPKFWRLSDQ